MKTKRDKETVLTTKNKHDIIRKKQQRRKIFVKKYIAIALTLVTCLSSLFLLSGCGKDDWNKGEPGEISFTINDRDPNMFGEIVTEEKAKELGFKKPRKITLYKVNDTKDGISSFDTYIDIETLTTEYLVMLENTFLNKEILINETTSIDG